MPTYIPGTGALEPKLMIIGDFPSKHDEETGVPFSGPSGYLLDQFLNTAGISRNDCYLTNVVKYRVPYNDLKKLYLINIDLQDEIKKLIDNEISRIRPNVILTLGELPLEAVTGFTGLLNYRGSILSGILGIKVIPTIHPSALYSKFGGASQGNNDEGETAKGGLNYVYTRLIQHDIRRAVEESNTPELNLPDRNLCIARDSLDLYRFFRQYDEYEKCAVDIESINCIPVCVGFAFSRHHAISVPILDSIGRVQLTNMTDNDMNECWRLIDKVLRTKKIIGHNYKYDDFKLSLFGFETPNVFSDTLIKTRILFPECPDKKLSTVASLWTREPYYKEEGKEFKLGKSKIDQLLLYNAKDCAVEFEVDEEQEQDLISFENRYQVPLRDYYYNYMMKKHKFYLHMENNGFRVDHARQKELAKRYIQLQATEHEKLIQLVGHDVNVKSAPQKVMLFRELGLPVYKKNPTSEDSIVKMLGTHCKGKDGEKKKAILEGILEESRIRDQRSRYINFSPDYDGRCKTSFNISATETCRSSTGILKKPIRPRKMGLAFHTISKHGRLAKDIRSMFIPDEGKVFLQADSSQAEARVVAVLSRDYELLKAFDTIDIHRRTAGLIFSMSSYLNLSEGFLEKIDSIGKDDPMRFAGKKTRHAGNYNMGRRRFMTEFNTDAQKFGIPMTVSEWKAGQMLDLFHAGSPKIRGIFHAEIQEALVSTRTLIDPFGGVRIFNGRMDETLFMEGYANIPQRTVAHLVQGAGIKVYDEIGDSKEAIFISENHDSLTLQVPANNWEPYARLLKKHMEAEIDFSKYCTLKRDVKLVIPCDVEIAETNYGDFKKVKVS